MTPLLAGLVLLGCTDDGSIGESGDASETSGTDATDSGTETGDSGGDGDGDPGDGDGDGDGDPGDGDGDDGDPGDGDGDPDPDLDMDGVPASEDCDDNDPNNFPGNTEVCDGQDNDCDGTEDGAVDATTMYVDGDGDGFGAGEAVMACEGAPGVAPVDGDCNDNDPAAYPGQDGTCALGRTCKAIADSGADTGDGLYLVDPDGVDAGQEPLELWCDMSSGGSTAALIVNSVNEGAYLGDFGAGYVSTQALALDPAQASSLNAGPIQAWLDLNEFPFEEFRLESYFQGSSTHLSSWIPATDLRIDFGQDGYLLWNSTGGYYWCGGDKLFTDGGSGQVNQPMGAPADCKNHAQMGSGWDFSQSTALGMGLSLHGTDGLAYMFRNWGSVAVWYPNPGAAYVIWTR